MSRYEIKRIAAGAFLVLTACATVTPQSKVVYTQINKVEITQKKQADSVRVLAANQLPQAKYIELGTLLITGNAAYETEATSQMRYVASTKGADAIILQPPIRKRDAPAVTYWAVAIKYIN